MLAYRDRSVPPMSRDLLVARLTARTLRGRPRADPGRPKWPSGL